MDEEFLPISVLQHVTYCVRRAALIHLDREWNENLYTAEGRVGHARVDHRGARRERRGDTPTGRGVVIWSDRLRISGIADAVEYRLKSQSGERVPFPVEYKRGRPRRERAFEVQLCAQGLCLEEMSGTSVPGGAILFTASRKRMSVAFDELLRAETISAIEKARTVLSAATLPRAEPGPKCRKCSMNVICMPRLTDGSHSVISYLASALKRG